MANISKSIIPNVSIQNDFECLQNNSVFEKAVDKILEFKNEQGTTKAHNILSTEQDFNHLIGIQKKFECISLEECTLKPSV